MDTEPLTKELEVFSRERDRLVAESDGKYVLIHGDDVAGVWDTYLDALKAGYDKYGLSPFLVKQIESVDRVFFFTKDIAPCQS